MSTDTLYSPTEKDERRDAFMRSERSQDHGTSAERNGRKLEAARDETYEGAIHNLGYRARQLSESLDAAEPDVDSRLRVMSPSELEDEADRMLAEDDLENTGIEKFNTSLRSAIAGNYANEDDLARELAVDRKMRGQSGHAGDPERFYQGRGSGIGVEYEPHLTDDEDLSDQRPLDGFSIKDRP